MTTPLAERLEELEGPRSYAEYLAWEGSPYYDIVGGVPVLLRSLLCLERCEEIDEIIVVTQPESLAPVSRMCKNGGVTKASKVVCGGSTRTQSALSGVCAANRRAPLCLKRPDNRRGACRRRLQIRGTRGACEGYDPDSPRRRGL